MCCLACALRRCSSRIFRYNAIATMHVLIYMHTNTNANIVANCSFHLWLINVTSSRMIQLLRLDRHRHVCKLLLSDWLMPFQATWQEIWEINNYSRHQAHSVIMATRLVLEGGKRAKSICFVMRSQVFLMLKCTNYDRPGVPLPAPPPVTPVTTLALRRSSPRVRM